MNYTISYLTNIEMFYPSHIISVIAMNIDNIIDEFICDKLIPFISDLIPDNIIIKYQDNLIYIILVSKDKDKLEKVYTYLTNNKIEYTVKKLSWRLNGVIAKIMNNSDVYDNLSRIPDNIKSN